MSRGVFDPRFQDLQSELPIFPLTGALLLPGGVMPLNIFEPRYLAMVDQALAGQRMIGMIQPSAPAEAGESFSDGDAPLYTIGCAGRIASFAESEDGRYMISLKGLLRFSVVKELPLFNGFRRAEVDFSPFRADMDERLDDELDRDRFLRILSEYFDLNSIHADWNAIKQTESHRLVNRLAMTCPFTPLEKQAILEAGTLNNRANVMEAIMEMSVYQARATGGAQ